ncbi:guanylate cyclase activator 2A [Phyllostomus discolor]|uniref:Guanylin n=1 Tax=Phyllostomus discolor TaxID=89673 RepID=A0A834AAW3_9CHIR|nr:guanylate cyclase activator 2A [Phyllostomus discolor]
MNTFLLAALCLLGSWAALAGGVTVQDGKFSFSLESVKKLRDLGDLQKLTRRSSAVVPNPCNYPNFPKELKPLCKERNAREILQRLEAIAEDSSSCEICAYAACTGC